MELQKTRRTLKYEFTDAEKLELGRDLSIKSQELRQLEEQKKSVVSDFGSRVSITKEQISGLSDKVASGYEMREVHCTCEYHHPEQNKKTYTRLDISESWVEPMNDTDHNLFNQWEEKNAARLKQEQQGGADPGDQEGGKPSAEATTEVLEKAMSNAERA